MLVLVKAEPPARLVVGGDVRNGVWYRWVAVEVRLKFGAAEDAAKGLGEVECVHGGIVAIED